MVKTHFLLWLLGFPLVISGYSSEVDQPTVATPVAPLESVSTLAPPTHSNPQTNIVTTTQVPVTWADLDLKGRLVYINGIVVENVFKLQIQILDLVTGEI